MLQAHISALRKSLGRDAIETHGGGYSLRLDTDLGSSRRSPLEPGARPTPAGRARVLRDALALWRGEPLAEIREPFAPRAVVRLTELRLEALSRVSTPTSSSARASASSRSCTRSFSASLCESGRAHS